MNNIFTIKQGDRHKSLAATLSDENGVIDLTSCTVNFCMKKSGGETLVKRAITVVSAVAGTVRVDWETTDTETAGTYAAEFEIVYADGKTLTVPNDSNFTVRVVAQVG